MKKLTRREEDFCRLYASLQNEAEAARTAGYAVLPKRAGARLLQREEIRQRILSIREKTDLLSQAKSGFRRLAFGSAGDAVRLITDPAADPESLDLFMVSSVKAGSSGITEIKFFDRQKALESLAELENRGDLDGPLSLYSALESSARLVSGKAGTTEEYE